MVGGDQDAYKRVEPLLRELGTPTHIGANSQGLVLKLAINISLAARAALVLDLPDEAWFDVGLMQKDVALALDTGRELRVPLPSAAVADQLLTVARALGYEQRDLAALFEVLGQLAGSPAERD